VYWEGEKKRTRGSRGRTKTREKNKENSFAGAAVTGYISAAHKPRVAVDQSIISVVLRRFSNSQWRIHISYFLQGGRKPVRIRAQMVYFELIPRHAQSRKLIPGTARGTARSLACNNPTPVPRNEPHSSLNIYREEREGRTRKRKWERTEQQCLSHTS
jgi:hypothetical protein